MDPKESYPVSKILDPKSSSSDGVGPTKPIDLKSITNNFKAIIGLKMHF